MSLRFLFNAKWVVSKLSWVVLLLFTSCSSSVYTVYDQQLNRSKIDISDSEKVFILKDFTTCIDCLKMVVSYYDGKKEVVVISVISKSMGSVIRENREINDLLTDSIQIFFQFSKKNNPYDYRRTNRIFKEYSDRKKSPIIFRMDNSGKIYGLTYQEFLESLN